ncbi:cobalt/nickel transport system ATP-binding protein [Natronobacillus azotifigens]|uniref:ABC transporter ATP-binding protein n=1 Tax=Natronobacillus azotifigens TaxID=472978 RepID=A0A9J6REJ3_9BACI|nr:ATP-binding cassette domain-containing protein [Natronobacillus azotifigens]MCZ0703780.1 ATP-binding cassette domain-containing protein [Natronobacillus azotifigens]
MNAIELNNVTYTYQNGMVALQNITLKVPIGAKVALLGPNGAGKSTLLHHINGLKLPTSGSVSIMGEKLTKKNCAAIRQKVGLVFQDPDDQVISNTVLEDVAFGPRNLKMSEKTVQEVCSAALGSVGMLEHKDRAPYQLSYGQKKRVAIAGVLAMHPDIVILDEPMASLDPLGQDEIAGLLQGLYYMGKTIILSTHDVNFAASWADMVILLKGGELLAAGNTDLLVDETLIRKANLHLPIVSRLFKLVPNLVSDVLPKNEQEAARFLFQWSQDKESRNTY